MSKAHALSVTGICSLLTLAGCGGLGSPVAFSPDGYQPIRPRTDRPFLVELPGEGGFTIHTRSSEQNPGQNGSADSAAQADPAGSALARASGANGGAAAATFALGAALHNDTPEPLPAAVTCDVEYEYSARTAVEEGGRGTVGQITLVMEAREISSGKLLFQHTLATLSGYEQDLHRTDQERIRFAASVAPNARWHVVLIGSTSVHSAGSGQAQVDLRIHRCRMVIARQNGVSSTQPGQ